MDLSDPERVVFSVPVKSMVPNLEVGCSGQSLPETNNAKRQASLGRDAIVLTLWLAAVQAAGQRKRAASVRHISLEKIRVQTTTAKFLTSQTDPGDKVALFDMWGF
jgi:hypothetical protein